MDNITTDHYFVRDSDKATAKTNVASLLEIILALGFKEVDKATFERVKQETQAKYTIVTKLDIKQ